MVHGFTKEVYQTVKRLAIRLKLFQKLRKEYFQKSFYEASITLIPKLDNGVIRKLQVNIPNEYWYENPLKKH